MTALHEAEVRSRFDLLHARFKREVEWNDVRLEAVTRAIAPVRGRQVLDLGCGKGRFAARLVEGGASVVGLDISGSMLAAARGFARVHASASRLPFPNNSFDTVVAIEVFEHLHSIERVLHEIKRVLRPGGVVAIVDKNAGSWNADRPWLPNLALKWIDECRGRWMYPRGGPVRERWFWPTSFRRRLSRLFVECRVDYLLTQRESECLFFRCVPPARLFSLWTASLP